MTDRQLPARFDDLWEHDRRIYQETFFERYPGFAWCGGCGRATRLLTNDEARDLLEAGLEEMEGALPVFIIEAMAIIFETHMRARHGLCQCRPLPSRDRKGSSTLWSDAPTTGYFLYRLWGDEDRLLYVGVSRALRNRLKTHVGNWGEHIRRISWEEHETAGAMLKAEATAIRTEFPAFNQTGV